MKHVDLSTESGDVGRPTGPVSYRLHDPNLEEIARSCDGRTAGTWQENRIVLSPDYRLRRVQSLQPRNRARWESL